MTDLQSPVANKLSSSSTASRKDSQADCDNDKVVMAQRGGSTTAAMCVDQTPTVLSGEFGATETPTGLQLNSSATVPACEFQPVSPRHRGVLLLSSCALDQQTSGDPQFGATFKHVVSLEEYGKFLLEFALASRSNGVASDLCVVHVLPVDEGGQPVVGGSRATESELYGPLNTCAYDLPSRVRVLQLTCRLEGNLQDSDRKTASSGCCGTASSHLSRRAFFCGIEVYRMVILDGANMLKVHEDLGRAFNAMNDFGREASGVEMAQQIVSCCSQKIQLVQFSGIPDGATVDRAATNAVTIAPGAPAFPEVPGGDPAVPEVPGGDPAVPEVPGGDPAVPEVPGGDPAVPAIADATETSSSSLERLFNKSPTECGQIPVNIAVAFIIQNYNGEHSDRGGCDKDYNYINGAAKCLGCCEEDIHLLYPNSRSVSKLQIQDHVDQILAKYEGKSSVGYIYVSVSAHGNRRGFITSDEETVQLKDVLQQLARLDGFILLFYQPCRGAGFHSASSVVPNPFINGLAFTSPDSAGSCLPPLPNCAAIFGSMQGYESYRNSVEGSWMLRVLKDVVSQGRMAFGVCQLVNMMQGRLHDLKPGGRILCEHHNSVSECFLQLQFTVNGGADVVIETTDEI